MAEQRTRRPHGPMGGPGRGMIPGEKSKDFKNSIEKLVRYLGRYWYAIVAVMIFAAVSTVFSVAGPKVMARATNALVEGLGKKIAGTGSIDFTYIAKVLLFTLGLYICSAVFSFIQGMIMTGITQKTCYRMRKEISEKINRMPMKYFESRTYGEVLSRITNDVDTLGQSLNQSVTQIITSVATLVGTLVMMISISGIMTLISLVILPVSAILISFIIKHSQKYFRQQQEYLGHINGQVEEVYGGHLVVQAYNKQESTIKKFEDTNQILFQSAWKSQFLSGLMQPIMQFVGNLGYVGVAISGGLLAIRGTIGVGEIQAFIQYVRNFTQPIQQIAQVANMLQSMAAASERVFEFLDEEEEELTVEHAVHLDHVDGYVDFSHVSFGYNPDQIIIRDFSAHVTPGQKIAIVGPTGAGKTTMVKLLMRFYDVTGGAIQVDGHDIRDFNRQELRDAFGMVLQDTWLFKGSIMENIRYGRLDATDEEVIEAAKAAHAHHFIQTLPGGYQMELNEDASNVSQGQKQLLTIARAILADNPILILDEATSSVDTRTEVRIQKALDNLMRGRTSFIIAHRLSTIRNADLKGSIMENIRYGRLDATDEEVIEAAKAAHAHHFIQTLPGGYQMELNEDASNVSQGQKQLLTIARAILADNPILILDEATSSVDTRTEVRIQKALDNLMRGRTSFIIAHRLSTIRNADLILVMKDGDIIEQGTHEQLLVQKGFYADLYNSQFEENA